MARPSPEAPPVISTRCVWEEVAVFADVLIVRLYYKNE